MRCFLLAPSNLPLKSPSKSGCLNNVSIHFYAITLSNLREEVVKTRPFYYPLLPLLDATKVYYTAPLLVAIWRNLKRKKNSSMASDSILSNRTTTIIEFLSLLSFFFGDSDFSSFTEVTSYIARENYGTN